MVDAASWAARRGPPRSHSKFPETQWGGDVPRLRQRGVLQALCFWQLVFCVAPSLPPPGTWSWRSKSSMMSWTSPALQLLFTSTQASPTPTPSHPTIRPAPPITHLQAPGPGVPDHRRRHGFHLLRRRDGQASAQRLAQRVGHRAHAVCGGGAPRAAAAHKAAVQAGARG